MLADGKPESGYEQLLWAYVLGVGDAIGGEGKSGVVMTVDLSRVRKMFDSVAGRDSPDMPDKKTIRRWIGDLQRLLPYCQPAASEQRREP